jgi:hypothetical protein
MSKTRTTFRWLTEAATRDSRWKRARDVPSCATSGAITFSATGSPVAASSAR